MKINFKNLLPILIIFFSFFVAQKASALTCETDTMHAGLQCRSADLKSWNKGTATTAGCNVESVCGTDTNGSFTNNCTTNTCILSCNGGFTVCSGGTYGTFCKTNIAPVSPCNQMNTCANTCTGCISGYTLCGSTCTATVSPTAPCSNYDTCNSRCTACNSGYSFCASTYSCTATQTCLPGQTFDPCANSCVGSASILKLGADSVSGSNVIQSLNPNYSTLFIPQLNRVGIGSSIIPSTFLQIFGDTSQSVNISGGRIGGLDLTPLSADEAVPLGYLQANYSSTLSSFWSGTKNGSIWNGDSGAGNVGIGTNDPKTKLSIFSPNASVAFFKSTVNNGNYSAYLGNGQTSSAEEFGLYESLTDTRLAVYDYANSLSLYGSSLSIGSNGNVGIGLGTTTPNFALDVNGTINASALYVNGSPYVGSQWITASGNKIYYNDGNVGIGTTSPAQKLHVDGIVKFNNKIILQNPNNSDTTWIQDNGYILRLNGFLGTEFSYGGSSGTVGLKMDSSGKVGIGTTTPNKRLVVIPVGGSTDDSINVGNAAIGGLDLTPLRSDQAVPLGYLQSNYSPNTASLWSGTKNGNIWNGDSGAGSVGIGTTAPGTYKLFVNGTANFSGNITAPNIAYSDGTILYHSIKWFTPTGTASSTGTTVTSSGTQFTSAMVNAKLIINGETRIISAYVANNQVTVSSAYSTNYSSVDSANWGVYSRAYETSFFDGTYNNLNNFRDSQNNRKMYFDANGNFTITSSYSVFNTVNATNYLIYGTGGLRFSPSNNDSLVDVRIKRTNGGILDIDSGTTGAYRDLRLRNLFADNIGIGTTSPSNKLQVFGGTGPVVSVSGGKIGGLDLVPLTDDQAVPLGYLKSNYLDKDTSGIGKFVGLTTNSYDGKNSASGVGYEAANDICAAQYTGSHVCASYEILNTIVSKQANFLPNDSSSWVFNGPPGYTWTANDCLGRNDNQSVNYGTVWVIPPTGGKGYGSLDFCNSVRKLACCK